MLSPFCLDSFETFAAILSTPTLSTDGDSLYFAGASNAIFAMSSESGRTSWTTDTQSVVLNRPKVFQGEDEDRIYVIESMDGLVRQLDADSGDSIWQFNCASITGLPTCQDSVEAEFRYGQVSNVFTGKLF